MFVSEFLQENLICVAEQSEPQDDSGETCDCTDWSETTCLVWDVTATDYCVEWSTATCDGQWDDLDPELVCSQWDLGDPEYVASSQNGTLIFKVDDVECESSDAYTNVAINGIGGILNCNKRGSIFTVHCWPSCHPHMSINQLRIYTEKILNLDLNLPVHLFGKGAASLEN